MYRIPDSIPTLSDESIRMMAQTQINMEKSGLLVGTGQQTEQDIEQFISFQEQEQLLIEQEK